MNAERIADIFVIFVIILVFVLKICNIITISWLWILAPLWIPFSIGLFLTVFIVIVIVIEQLKEK